MADRDQVVGWVEQLWTIHALLCEASERVNSMDAGDDGHDRVCRLTDVARDACLSLIHSYDDGRSEPRPDANP